jgi:FkbM family methyltransferase
MSPFKLERLPFSVHVENALSRVPVLRRWAKKLASLPFIPSTGLATYRESTRIRFNGRNHQFHALYDGHYAHGYEVETSVLLSLLLRGSGAFVDCGSNWGYFALLAASLPEFSGRCLCFEPHPATFADLVSLVAQTQLSDRIDVHQQGVGQTSGTLHVSETRGASGLTQLVEQRIGPQVEVVALDEVVNQPVKVIKIDVEGMELDVLKGARKVLLEQQPWVIFENTLTFDHAERTFAPLHWLEQQDWVTLLPALKVKRGLVTVPHHYGSPPPASSTDIDFHRMSFLPVTAENRFLLHPQLNLLACPRHRLTELPGEILT